jgi:hypothetical protein
MWFLFMGCAGGRILPENYGNDKGKVARNLTKQQAMKLYWGSTGIAPRILTSALRGDEWSVSRPGLFYLWGKNPRYPLDRRLGGPQRRSGRGSEEKNSRNFPCWELNLVRRAHSMVTILTELPRLPWNLWLN